MPPRRQVLRVATWGGLGLALGPLLTGCRIRLEDDAPTIPFLSRQPIPDEAAIMAAYHRAVGVADLAGRALATMAAEVRQRHTRHAQVLRAILDAGEVPERIIRAAAPAATSAAISTSVGTVATSAPPGTAPGWTSTAGSTGPGPSAGSTPTVSDADLAQAVRTAAEAGVAAASGLGVHRILGAAVAAHDSAEAAHLGASITWPGSDHLPEGVARELLQVTRAARYGLQVAASRLPAAEHDALLGSIAVLDRREHTLAADLRPAPSPPLGYALPFSPSGPDEARRLVRVVLGTTVDRGWDAAESIPAGSSAVISLIRLQTEAVLLATGHGVQWPTLPGLVVG